MLKMVEGLGEKMQDENGFWTKEFEQGFWVYIDRDEEINVCNELQRSGLESHGYKLIWVGSDDMGENPDDVIDYIDSQVSTLDVEQTIKNLIGIEVTDDVINDIICAFDTTEKEVIVSSPDEMNSFNGRDGIHSAYENLEDAPIIKFKIEDGKIVDAWEA